MKKGCGTIYLGATREFYGNRVGKADNCGSNWTPDKISAFGEDTTKGGGNNLIDSLTNPTAVEDPRICTKIVGFLYNERGTQKSYTDGCQKSDLMDEGFIYLDPPNQRLGSDLEVDQTRTALNNPAPTSSAIPTRVAFYSPWNRAGTIKTINVSATNNPNPCGNPNYNYRSDSTASFYDNSVIGDPYCYCDKSYEACNLNPVPAQPQANTTPLVALVAFFLFSQ